MIQELTYQDANGQPVKTAYMTHGSAYQLTGNREQFAMHMAQGKSDIESYCLAFAAELTPDSAQDIKEAARKLCRDTTVVLRIQELKRPVLRKLARKIEFNQEKALHQANTAWDLAYALQDVKGMLAATKLQAELCKLLVHEIEVTHKHGVLDEESTATLLELMKMIQVRKASQKAMVEKPVKVIGSESATPHRPLLAGGELVPSETSTKISG